MAIRKHGDNEEAWEKWMVVHVEQNTTQWWKHMNDYLQTSQHCLNIHRYWTTNKEKPNMVNDTSVVVIKSCSKISTSEKMQHNCAHKQPFMHILILGIHKHVFIYIRCALEQFHNQSYVNTKTLQLWLYERPFANLCMAVSKDYLCALVEFMNNHSLILKLYMYNEFTKGCS